MENNFLILSVLVFLPIIPALLILSPIFPRSAVIVRRFTKWFAGIHFIYSYLFLLFFNPNALALSFKNELLFFNTSWSKTMGISAYFALDGLSLILCILTTFIFFITLIISKYSITIKHKFYYSLMLLLEGSILGIFCAKSMILMFLFLSLSVILLYFLILNWGTSKKEADKFLIFNFIGNMFILFGILILYYYSFSSNGILTDKIESLEFDELANPIWLQILAFSCFLLGFCTRLPLFPLHMFISKINETVPMPINILFPSVIFGIGIYGIIELNMQLFPTTFLSAALIMMLLAITGIIHCSLCAFIQKNIKQIIFYLSTIFANFIILGLSTVSIEGIKGAIFMTVSTALAFTALYIISGIVYLRTKTLNIIELGGLSKKMTKLMYFAIPICITLLGVPFLIMFPPEIMIITGAFNTELLDEIPFQIAGIIAVFSLFLTACAVLKFLHGIFFGNMLTKYSDIKDLNTSEFVSLLGITIPILIFGIAPNLLINIYDSVVLVLMEILRI